MSEPSTTSSRPELPREPDALAPMGPAFEEALEIGLGELDLLDDPAGSAAARASYEGHARLLREWGVAINLTAIRDPAEIARRHIIDSLSALPILRPIVGAESLLDLGSGAGYPGLPLVAGLPIVRLGLLDSVRKKARFMEVAAAAVFASLADGPTADAPQIDVFAERAEDLAEELDQRGSWQVVTARAVGSLAEVVELGMPLVREGGAVIAWKHGEERAGLRAELQDAGSIIRATGGGRPDVVVVEAASLVGHRLVVVPKERPTPSSYPRPVAKRPRRKRK
jgi:16S rRNA (guanine527-N7)-methyltransferase